MNLKDIITDWKVQYGLQKEAKSGATYYVIPVKDRVELLSILVDILRDNYGYATRDQFDKQVVRVMAEGCVWIDGPDRKKIGSALAAIIKNDIPIVLSNAFRDLTNRGGVSVVDATPETEHEKVHVNEFKDCYSCDPSLPQPPADEDEEVLPEEDSDSELTAHALALATKPLARPKDAPESTPDSVNHALMQEIGIDPKEFGYE